MVSEFDVCGVEREKGGQEIIGLALVNVHEIFAKANTLNLI